MERSKKCWQLGWRKEKWRMEGKNLRRRGGKNLRRREMKELKKKGRGRKENLWKRIPLRASRMIWTKSCERREVLNICWKNVWDWNHSVKEKQKERTMDGEGRKIDGCGHNTRRRGTKEEKEEEKSLSAGLDLFLDDQIPIWFNGSSSPFSSFSSLHIKRELDEWIEGRVVSSFLSCSFLTHSESKKRKSKWIKWKVSHRKEQTWELNLLKSFLQWFSLIQRQSNDQWTGSKKKALTWHELSIVDLLFIRILFLNNPKSL